MYDEINGVKKDDTMEMTEMQRHLMRNNYNQYINDLAAGDKEAEEEHAQARRQALEEIKAKDEIMKKERERFEAAKSPKKKKRVVPAAAATEGASNLPKVTKKELNLLKSLTEEEKESFKKQVEDDEAVLEGLNRRISDKCAGFSINYVGKGDLTELKSLNNPPELVKQLICMIQVQFGVPPNDVSWANWKKMNANPSETMKLFINHDKDHLNLEAYKVI